MSVRLERKRPKKKPMTQVPRQSFVHRGYGVIPVSHNDWANRILATQVVRDLIASRTLPLDSESAQESLSIVKGMFSRIYVGDCYDWYTTSRFLGHPSGELSKVLSTNMSILKGALREQSVKHFNDAVDRFTNNYGLEMLDNYMDMTVSSAYPVKEEGWAYVLWSSSEADVLHMGAAGGEIEDVLGRLNVENPDRHPYGVLAAWLVHDPVDAYNDIRRAFDGEFMGDGFFRVDFGKARERIGALLKETDNFALSPWHDSEHDLAVASKPTREATLSMAFGL